MTNKIIVFCAGGTAGHLFPAAALGATLKEKGYITHLISDKRGEKYASLEFNSITTLPVAKLGTMFFLKAPYLLLKSLYLIRGAKKVICFGGYTTLFPFLAALLLRKERIIYQLDSRVTRLNRYLIPLANQVFYAFAQTDVKKKNNTYCFGIPLRNGFEFSFINKRNSFNIAIIGGSLGSSYWKNLIEEMFELLPQSLLKTIHLKIQTTESTDFLKKFQLASIESQAFYDTAKLFQKSHFIIARAGATSIAEISSVARPAYLVPWMEAIENHQHENAKNYADFKGAKFGNNARELAEYIIQIAKSDDVFHLICQNAANALPQYAKNKASALLAQDM